MRKPSQVGVVGLDLSLRCSAAVYLPADWDPGEPRRGLEFVTGVGFELAKDDLAGHVRRLYSIGFRLADFVDQVGARHVYVEGAAYAQSAFAGIKLGELAGAVKYAVFERNGVVTIPVNMQRARKLFLGGGTLPRGAATVVAARVREMGFGWETSDPGDALVVASWGRSELGMTALSIG